MNAKANVVSNNLIYILLVVLALLSVATTFLSLSPSLSNWYVYGIAALMATLVLLQYMDLKSEGLLVIAFFVVPSVIFAILVVLVSLADPNGPRIPH